MKSVKVKTFNRAVIFYLLMSAYFLYFCYKQFREIIEVGPTEHLIGNLLAVGLLCYSIYLIGYSFRSRFRAHTISWGGDRLIVTECKRQRKIEWDHDLMIQEDQIEYHLYSKNGRVSLRKSMLSEELSEFIKTRTRGEQVAAGNPPG